MAVPVISVIIPTYEREEALRDTLGDLIEQDYPAFEVLVVDQTKVHQLETQEYLEKLANTGKIRWFKVNWASLPGARNYAIRRAIGEVILFIDDDVQLPTGFLLAHARNYQEHPEIGAVAGRVFDRMKLQEKQAIEVASSLSPAYTIEDLPPEAMDAGIAWYYIDLVHTIKPQRVLTARGCNMSFRSEIFTKYKLRFDERFKGSAVREESDFCLRLRETNLHIWYDPEAYLVHLGEETGGCHDISTKTAKYQVSLYHNHFLMAFKNLTTFEQFRLCWRLFDCQVLGHPPCNKSGSPLKTVVRASFYIIGFIRAIATVIQSVWDDAQIYSELDELKNI
ncbi:MAG TPA: hormogonium polysaccharide biosynthesis glycosyltransferase HpsN [Oculatellaceae cyanobacterium]|jgi:glycosyltransferase involved in cell wall biosynthesis